MISAVNLRRLLNGNKFIIYLFVFNFVFIACATKKKVVYTTPNKGAPSKKENSIPAKVDTLTWTAEDKGKPSKSNDNKQSDNDPKFDTPKYKNKINKEENVYRVVCLLPFKTIANDTAASKINSSSYRFIQYYSGMNIAIEEQNKDQGKRIEFDTYDCESAAEVGEILSKYDRKPPHLIIGPQKVEALKFASEWAKSHETSLLSPWVSSSSIAEDNPFYVQIKSGLTAHYENINQHARAHFPAENIILISKSEDESKARYFNDSTQYKNITEKVIKESDLSTGVDPIIAPLLKENGPTVFILPLASSKDENYIYHFIRRMASEKTNKEIIIYGMYKWLEMKSDIIDFLNIYKIRLSVGNYFDPDDNDIKSFKRRYFDKYREFPSQDALEGYDLTKYCIKALRQIGPEFQWKNEHPNTNYLETDFIIKPVIKLKDIGQNKVIDYYENAYLKIVEIRNNKYKIVD
ncbi:MAG: ABC transporter substrate-binding protein [Saprospiraceae bacterium]